MHTRGGLSRLGRFNPPRTCLPVVAQSDVGTHTRTAGDASTSPRHSAFGLSAYPYFVALDADHEVVARGTGELSTDQWESLLEAARG